MTAVSEEKSHSRYERAQHQRRSSIHKIHHSPSMWSDPFFIVVLALGLTAVIGFFAAMLHKVQHVEAFSPVLPTHRSTGSTTRIFLEDWVADMIDNEIYRQDHHKEYEAKWMEKNKGAVLSRLSDTMNAGYPSVMIGEEDREAYAEHRKDERMAFLKPQKYCQDRCVATGNCDILEDFYELGPEDVLKFCEECVLSEEEDNECDVPEAFYEKEPPLRP